MRLKKLVSIVLVAAMSLTVMAMPASAANSPHRHNRPSNSGGGGGGGGGGVIATGTTSSSGTIGDVYYGWHYVPEVDKWWYEYNDRTWAVGWAELYWKPLGASEGYMAYYHFDDDGWMDTGWYHDPKLNSDYYLHPYADGTRGYMYTGTQNVGGKSYEFEDKKGQNQGHLKSALR